MKLIFAIVRNDNESDVVTALSSEGYIITRLNTTGMFLRRGNVTLMIGTEDDRVDHAVDIIRRECGPRQKLRIERPVINDSGMPQYSSVPVEVEVGGAAVFVVDVESYEHF